MSNQYLKMVKALARVSIKSDAQLHAIGESEVKTASMRNPQRLALILGWATKPMKLKGLVDELSLDDPLDLKCHVELRSFGNRGKHAQVLAKAVVSSSHDVGASDIKNSAAGCSQLLYLGWSERSETLRADASTSCEQKNQPREHQQSLCVGTLNARSARPPNLWIRRCGHDSNSTPLGAVASR
jgi:hypothetical protein